MNLTAYIKVRTENSDENFHLYLYENYFKKYKKDSKKYKLSFDTNKILKKMK